MGGIALGERIGSLETDVKISIYRALGYVPLRLFNLSRLASHRFTVSRVVGLEPIFTLLSLSDTCHALIGSLSAELADTCRGGIGPHI